MEHDLAQRVLADLLGQLGADARPHVHLHGRADALPSPFAVSAFASASVASALCAIALLQAERNRAPLAHITLDRREAAAAFRSERALRGIDFRVPDPWDPIAGDYATRDGHVRLHTNYASHRSAALRALGAPGERDAVAARVALRGADELERSVIAEGGAAAALHSATTWRAHPQGRALANEPLVAVARGGLRTLPLAPHALPLAGVRVLDFTRVIAGPVATRVLAAHGADVLRIDPPDFEEVPALLGDTTWGKRRAFLDLKSAAGRTRCAELVREAHVVVVGYRSAALAALGLTPEALAAANPGLVTAHLNAYGHSGPWRERRGFDSLVQMSCGIAARGRELAGGDAPVPLPAQALDHGTGYLLAAAIALALRARLRDGRGSALRLSLARTAMYLMSLGDDHPRAGALLTADELAHYAQRVDSAFGVMERLPVPGSIAGVQQVAHVLAGPLGVHDAAFRAPELTGA